MYIQQFIVSTKEKSDKIHFETRIHMIGLKTWL